MEYVRPELACPGSLSYLIPQFFKVKSELLPIPSFDDKSSPQIKSLGSGNSNLPSDLNPQYESIKSQRMTGSNASTNFKLLKRPPERVVPLLSP